MTIICVHPPTENMARCLLSFNKPSRLPSLTSASKTSCASLVRQSLPSILHGLDNRKESASAPRTDSRDRPEIIKHRQIRRRAKAKKRLTGNGKAMRGHLHSRCCCFVAVVIGVVVAAILLRKKVRSWRR